ncbi:MAG: SIR2 family protein [Pseudomonadota bacterium]
MSDFFEIAYAAVSNRLCLFTGTGFSKAVTGNNAPSWQALLESMCDMTEQPNSLKEALFPSNGKNPLNLEEAAQIISIELLKQEKNIHQLIANLIKSIELDGDNSSITEFLSTRSLRIVTTNYDKLIEKLTGESDCHSLTPGLPIPRSQAKIKVYHVHGSIDVPENMVVTSDDYFKFINKESYFSRKLSTILHENIIVILGYSLGDTNLKAIISDYKGFSRNHIISSNIFLISRSEVSQQVKDYYFHSYGIRVLDNIDIHSFFTKLNASIPNAEKCTEASLSNIKKVIYDNHYFSKDFLRDENTFFEIISSLAAIGISINDDRVVSALGRILESKIELTLENNAWNQYVHLAKWLIYLASILELKNTSIENIFLAATLRSMNTMSKKLLLGFSWHAYQSWNTQWGKIISSNRSLIKNYIENNTTDPDALEIVRRQ